MLKDLGNPIEVNIQLEKMHVFFFFNFIEFTNYRGYNIGIRLIDDFLANSNFGRCGSFFDTADVIAKVF